jgi:hypothetical protein
MVQTQEKRNGERSKEEAVKEYPRDLITNIGEEKPWDVLLK